MTVRERSCGRTLSASWYVGITGHHRDLDTSCPIERWTEASRRSMAYLIASATVVVMTLYLDHFGSKPE